ncbi:histidine phosphatase family protein [Ekhidna sp.]|uniref:histidine phosphatase family protein n=1 Tax=Ekhidna sp. TaxID=2608089 RepID=UPI003C7B6604
MIYLIRHGQAGFLKENYDQLSELGARQAQLLGKALKERNQSVSKIISGSLIRHRKSVDHSLESYGQKLSFTLDDRWNEYDHMELLAKYNPKFTDHSVIGDHLMKEENPMRSLQQILNNSISDWIKGEKEYVLEWQLFKENSWKALKELADQLKSGENAWVFTSGGPISAILIQLLSLKDEQFIDLQGRLVNSSVTKVLVGKNGLSLSTYNDYSHLDHNRNLITYR